MSDKKNSVFRENMRTLWQWTYRLRSLVLAIPVAMTAVVLAIRNITILPAVVTFDVAAIKKGELVFQSIAVAKGVAVMAPLMITLCCLVLTFCSKKVVYPWLVSLFSLVIPLVLALVNTFV